MLKRVDSAATIGNPQFVDGVQAPRLSVLLNGAHHIAHIATHHHMECHAAAWTAGTGACCAVGALRCGRVGERAGWEWGSALHGRCDSKNLRNGWRELALWGGRGREGEGGMTCSAGAQSGMCGISGGNRHMLCRRRVGGQGKRKGRGVSHLQGRVQARIGVTAWAVGTGWRLLRYVVGRTGVGVHGKVRCCVAVVWVELQGH